MKNLNLKSTLVILITVLGLNFSFAKNPEYKLTTGNVNRTAANIMEFDIYLQNTNSSDAKLQYVLGQYFFDFNPEIANGGTLIYSLVNSDLPQALQPRNPSVSGNQLRLASNAAPSKENLPVISEKSPGTLIARMRLETSAKSFSDVPLNLKLRVGPENPFTKVFAYIDNQIIDVTNKEEVVADNIAGKNVDANSEIPKEFALSQNYPNPFNPSATINFDIPKLSVVKLSIYDITGREIAVLVNEQLQPGSYNYKFDGSNFASGVYFYRLKAGDFVQVRKMVLIK